VPSQTASKTPYFELRKSPIAGTGAFAIRPIKKGARIIEYVGERISNDEADERYDDSKMKKHHTFLFSIDDDTTIDAGVRGNDARFINHSCDPNCEAVDEKGRIFIEATRDIAPEEELAYDYRFTLGDDIDYTDAKLQQRYMCKCGARNCRGTMLDGSVIARAKRKKSAAAKRKKAASSKKSRERAA
jgi:SET domain-containing protein